MDMMNNIYNPLQPSSPYAMFSTPSSYAAIDPVLQTQQHMEIIKVNGQKGAEHYNMGPNSSALLLDMNDPLIWFVQTDGAGYKTCIPYSITPYEPPQELDIKTLFNQLNTRLTNIEERMQKNESNNGITQSQSATRTEFNI